MTGMARPLQFQSAVLHSDSQTRPAVQDSGHQLPAAQGCGTAVQVPRLPQCGRHRLPALHEGGPPVRELQPAPSGNQKPTVQYSGTLMQEPALPECGQGILVWLPSLVNEDGPSSLQSTTEAPRCQQQHFYSVATITTMSSIQLYKALPAGEEEGRKEINTPNQVFILQPAVPPPLPYRHISTCSVRDPTSYITS